MSTIKEFFTSRLGKIALFSLTGLLLLGLTAGAMARRFQPGPWMIKKFVKQLDLTTDQKARLRIIYTNATHDRKANRTQMKAIQAKIKALLKEEQPNKQELDGLVSQAFDNAKQIALSKTIYLLRAHDVLTPKQRQLIRTNLERIQSRMKKRRQQWKKQHKPGDIPWFLK